MMLAAASVCVLGARALQWLEHPQLNLTFVFTG